MNRGAVRSSCWSVRFSGGKRDFTVFQNAVLDLGPSQPPINVYQGLFSLRVKRPEPEAEHSPPSSVESKNERNYTATSSHVFVKFYVCLHICMVNVDIQICSSIVKFT